MILVQMKNIRKLVKYSSVHLRNQASAGFPYKVQLQNVSGQNLNFEILNVCDQKVELYKHCQPDELQIFSKRSRESAKCTIL